MANKTMRLTPSLFGQMVALSIGEILNRLRELPEGEQAAALCQPRGGPLGEAAAGGLYSLVAGFRVQSIGLRIPREGRLLIDGRAYLPIAQAIQDLIPDPAIHGAAVITLAATWRNALRESEAVSKLMVASPRRYANRWPDAKVSLWDPYAVVAADLHPVVRATEISMYLVKCLEILAASRSTGYHFPQRGIGFQMPELEPEILAMVERGLSDRDIASRLGVSRSRVLRLRVKSNKAGRFS